MKKEEILTNCIDDIQAGKCTLEDCLVKYPELSGELRSLLEIAASIESQWVEAKPTAEFKERVRANILEVMRADVREESRWAELLGWFRSLVSVRRVSVVATVSVLALLIAGTATVYASQGSAPGDVLYPVKALTERVRLAFSSSDIDKAVLHVTFAEDRVQEMAEMGKEGQIEVMVELSDTLAGHLEQTVNLTESSIAEDTEIDDLKSELELSATQQLAILEEALSEVPELVRPSFTDALITVGEEYGTAIDAVTDTGTPPMLASNMGTVLIHATDPPPPEVDSVLVTVSQIEIHRSAGSDSGWLTIVSQPVTFDLLKIAEVQAYLGSQDVPEGTYTQLRFITISATVIVNGESYSASIPSGKLRIVRPFQVEEGETTLILLDFDGVESLHVTGGGQYQLEPRVKLLVPPVIRGAAEKEEETATTSGKAGTKQETRVAIEGTIVDYTDTELILVVGGKEVRIGIDSSTRIKGALNSGSWARVKAVLEDGALLAKEVKVGETGEDNEDSGGGNREDEDEGGVEAEDDDGDEDEDDDKGKGKGKDKDKDRDTEYGEDEDA